jgi:hypothetical protein
MNDEPGGTNCLSCVLWIVMILCVLAAAGWVFAQFGVR